jgi:prepilin-type N-terminal cleavage/methylation domain-containing protein
LRNGGFTLLEVMAVIVIVCILAAMLISTATMARNAARVKKCNVVLDILATASENYWATFHDYPYPDPGYVGIDQTHMADLPDFQALYLKSGSWDPEAYNVTLVWLMSADRRPEPFLSTDQFCFKPVMDSSGKNQLLGPPPEQRKLYKVVDGFGNSIRLDRPSQYYYSRTYITFTSAGQDGIFGVNPKRSKDPPDDIVRKIQR